MRRVNKILMATVAILLCLVLISTSVVSGIFAKFIIQQQGQVSAVIEKFGVKVYLIPDTTAITNAGGTVTPVLNDYSKNEASLEIKNLNLKPGTDLSEALKIRFDGETTVPLKVTVTFTFSYTLGSGDISKYRFYVPEGIGNIPAGGLHMVPVGLKFGAQNIVVEEKNGTVVENVTSVINSDYATNLTPYYYASSGNAEIYLVRHLKSNLDVTSSTNSDDYISKEFSAGDSITFKSKGANSQNANILVFGFEWPDSYELTRTIDGKEVTFDSDTIDRASAFLANNGKNKSMTFTYTVKIEQTGA